jgi:hypothetical protein
MTKQCYLPIVNKETGEISYCQNQDLQPFMYEGLEFYFCPEHYKLFTENIDALSKKLQEEVENLQSDL